MPEGVVGGGCGGLGAQGLRRVHGVSEMRGALRKLGMESRCSDSHTDSPPRGRPWL